MPPRIKDNMNAVKEEIIKERQRRVEKITSVLKKLFPDAKIALRYKNPFELLVAVILSVQCTDKKVNEVTARLFKKYKTLDDYVNTNQKEFEQDIRPTGFYKNKARYILTCAKIIKEKFNGKVPDSMEDLLTLPGVARKTANIVLGNAFKKVDGIAVDTHVSRLTRKLGLTDNINPVKIEKDLMVILPKKEWFSFTYRLIEYGRKICPARFHDCRDHPLTKIWPKAAKIWPK